jgi:phosphotriesterase-related protein
LQLRAEGFVDRILLSHDICETGQLRSHGGGGYAFLFEVFLDILRKRGLANEELERLVTVNPQRALVG